MGCFPASVTPDLCLARGPHARAQRRGPGPLHPIPWASAWQVGRTGAESGADLEVARLHDLRAAMPGLWAERPHAPPPAPAAAPGVAAGRRELRRLSTAELIRQGADEEAERGDPVPSPLAGERGVLVPAQE